MSLNNSCQGLWQDKIHLTILYNEMTQIYCKDCVTKITAHWFTIEWHWQTDSMNRNKWFAHYRIIWNRSR